MSERYAALFGPCALIGVVHLKPLPGSPGYGGQMEEVLRLARADAEALARGGVDGVIVENFGDTPFYPGAAPPVTIAAMTVAALTVSDVLQKVSRPPRLGLNVLRNDAAGALGIAAAVGASFIRVNVHTGAMLTDQGPIHGMAHETLRARHALGLSELAVLCDVLVKHAVPLGPQTLVDTARDTRLRGGADGLIVSGAGTGLGTQPASLAAVRDGVPGAPLLVGSGATLATLGALLEVSDGVIVGTALKENGEVHRPVDPRRVEAFVNAREARL